MLELISQHVGCVALLRCPTSVGDGGSSLFSDGATVVALLIVAMGACWLQQSERRCRPVHAPSLMVHNPKIAMHTRLLARPLARAKPRTGRVGIHVHTCCSSRVPITTYDGSDGEKRQKTLLKPLCGHQRHDRSAGCGSAYSASRSVACSGPLFSAGLKLPSRALALAQNIRRALSF